MRTNVILPDLGVGARPIRLSVWFAEPGDPVYEGDRLVEVLVAGATFDVPAPATGHLAEILTYADESVHPGQILGTVELEDENESPA